MGIMNKVGIIFLGFLFTLLLGSWLGRTDIAKSCDDTDIFIQDGVTYICYRTRIGEEDE